MQIKNLTLTTLLLLNITACTTEENGHTDTLVRQDLERQRQHNIKVEQSKKARSKIGAEVHNLSFSKLPYHSEQVDYTEVFPELDYNHYGELLNDESDMVSYKLISVDSYSIIDGYHQRFNKNNLQQYIHLSLSKKDNFSRASIEEVVCPSLNMLDDELFDVTSKVELTFPTLLTNDQKGGFKILNRIINSDLNCFEGTANSPTVSRYESTVNVNHKNYHKILEELQGDNIEWRIDNGLLKAEIIQKNMPTFARIILTYKKL